MITHRSWDAELRFKSDIFYHMRPSSKRSGGVSLKHAMQSSNLTGRTSWRQLKWQSVRLWIWWLRVQVPSPVLIRRVVIIGSRAILKIVAPQGVQGSSPWPSANIKFLTFLERYGIIISENEKKGYGSEVKRVDTPLCHSGDSGFEPRRNRQGTDWAGSKTRAPLDPQEDRQPNSLYFKVR